MIGRLLQWMHAPGLVRTFEYDDPDTGEKVTARTSPQYTVLTIGSRELYFRRSDGSFDGTGAMALDDDEALTRLRADCIRRSNASRAAAGQPRPP